MSAILDIDLLRTFHTIARSGRFKAAAEQLHKSPAAISVHVQRLEAVAGGRLLERSNQSVALTPLGTRLLAATSDLLRNHDRVLADLHGGDLAGHLRLGVPDEYAEHVIRDILPSFTAQRPNLVLEVQTAPSLALRERLERGALDLAVVAQAKGAGSRHQGLLASTTPVWVSAISGPDASADPLPLALYGRHCPYRQAMFEALESSSRRWRVVLESASSQVVKACVESGLAVTLLDRARATSRMRILANLPEVADHEIVLLASQRGAPVAQLEQALLQHFRL